MHPVSAERPLTYPHHEPLQLPRPGAILLHEGADADEGGKAEDEEDEAHHQVDQEGCQHQVAEGGGVPQADEAHAGEDVAWKGETNNIYNMCTMSY